jgi:DNA modification methylase
MGTTVSIEAITKRIQVRRIRSFGVERLKEKIAKMGFLPQHPLLVVCNQDGGLELLDGNHRLEAAIALGMTTLPVHVLSETLSESDKKRLARQANEAAETMIPTTFADDAEFVWKQSDEGYTQEEIKGMLGWSVDKVTKYHLLRRICKPAWEMILTTVDRGVSSEEEDHVRSNLTSVSFTEGLLRSILDLTDSQQLELVTELATNPNFSKGKFRQLSENYHIRNKTYAEARAQLGELGEAYTDKLHDEVYSGAYDADWKTADHPKLCKLIAALRDEWERKNSIHLIHGDFYEEVQKIGSGSINLILTDPPYNIARENEFFLSGRQNISQDFGAWDKHEEEDFVTRFPIWAIEWARILRSEGSGYVFTSDRFVSLLRATLERAGLHVKATIVWHKTNPGTQVVKTNFRSSVEYILFFTKGEGGHTFNWQGENEMHNFIEAPICAGAERLVDARGRTLHPTQKPERIIRHLMEISSNRGDTVFDGFAGVFTTARVAKCIGRKFIGIEQDKTFFDAAVRRLNE